MSLISEISSLFHFSPQIHRQAWMGISWKWHWNSRNQQFCTGIDPSPLTQVCNIYLCIPALVLALWTVSVFHCSNRIFYTLSMILGLGSVTLFVKWMLLHHLDKFLITSDWAYGELNLMRNLMVQQNLKPPLLFNSYRPKEFVAVWRGEHALFRPDFPWMWIWCDPSG